MSRLTKRFETFDHGADIGIRGYGSTLEETFSNIAKGLFSYMYGDNFLHIQGEEKEIEIDIEEDDITSLLIKWINTLLAISDINSLIFIDYNLKITPPRLSGTAIGVKVPPNSQGIEVKGATYCEAKVELQNGIWIAQCVIDV